MDKKPNKIKNFVLLLLSISHGTGFSVSGGLGLLLAAVGFSGDHRGR